MTAEPTPIRLPDWTTPEEQQRMLAEQVTAQHRLLNFLGRSSVGISIANRSVLQASGTLLEWRGRFFIATAAHVLEDLCQHRALEVAAPRQTTEFAAQLVFDPTPGLTGARRCVPLNAIAEACFLAECDLAVVELAENALASLPGMEPLNEGHLGGDPSDTTNIQVIGFPFEIAELGVPRPDRVLFSTHLKRCDSAKHTKDGHDRTRKGLDSDLHFDWSMFARGRGEYIEGLSPVGMSGGGVWMCEAGRAWSDETPRECARLLGIPWLWQPVTKCCRAISAQHLIALLRGI